MEPGNEKLTINLETLEEKELMIKIPQIMIKQISKQVVFEGVLKKEKDETLVSGGKIQIERKCKDCKQKAETFDTLSDEKGKFKITVNNCLAGEQYKIKFVISKEDLATKTQEETLQPKESDAQTITKQINFSLKQELKIFQLEANGQIKESNGIGVSNTRSEIQIINVDKTGKQSVVQKQVGSTDKDGKYNIKINVEETAENDIIVKATPIDKWAEGKSIETKITLDLEKQKKKELQTIEQAPIQVILTGCKSFTLSGKVIGDETGKELINNMKGIENAQIELKLKESSTGKEKTIKGVTSKDGNYKIEIEKWMSQGIEYTAMLTVEAPHFQQFKQELTIKALEETDTQEQNLRLKTNLVEKKLQLKGKVMDSDSVPYKGAEICLMEKKGEKWIETTKGATNKEGKYELEGEIVGDKDSVIEARLRVKGDYIETKEQKLLINLKEKVPINSNIEIVRKQGQLQLIGKVVNQLDSKPFSDVKVTATSTNKITGKLASTVSQTCNDKGEFDISLTEKIKMGLEYEIKITTLKLGFAQINEVIRNIIIEQNKMIIEEIQIDMKAGFAEITLEVKGKVGGKVSGQILKNAKLVLKGKYQDENQKEQILQMEGETNSLGEFDLKQKIKLSQSTKIACEMKISQTDYETKDLTFSLTETTSFTKTYTEQIGLAYNFEEQQGFANLIGQISRKEQCGTHIVSNPIPQFNVKFYLQDYYDVKTLYSTVKTNENGEFQIKAPVFKYTDYQGLIYCPYSQIEENKEDAYLSSTQSLTILHFKKDQTINLGNIELANGRDRLFPCSSK